MAKKIKANYLFTGVLMAFVLIAYGCAAKEAPKVNESEMQQNRTENSCNIPCDDNNNCTIDKCSSETGYLCVNEPIPGCCGNGQCEGNETYEVCPSDCEPKMSPELSEIFGHSSRITNGYSYTYRKGPEGYRAIVFGSKVKQTYSNNIRYAMNETFLFDTVFLDASEKTAYGYCVGFDCTQTKRAAVLDFNKYYKEGPFERLSEVKYAERAGQETIENKNCVIISYKDSAGRAVISSVEEYYGFPYYYIVKDSKGKEVDKVDYLDHVVNIYSEEGVTLPEDAVIDGS